MIQCTENIPNYCHVIALKKVAGARRKWFRQDRLPWVVLQRNPTGGLYQRQYCRCCRCCRSPRWQRWRPSATMGPCLWEGTRTVESPSRCRQGGVGSLGLSCSTDWSGRQRMDDRTYSEDFFTKWVNRSGGGPNLEWVDSPNLDCPLSR